MIVKTVSELHTQIDLNQLTTDFGGNLVYDHEAWIFLHKVCSIRTTISVSLLIYLTIE